MEILFGTMDDVVGRSATHGEWTFVPCIGEPDDPLDASHRLSEHLPLEKAPAFLRKPLEQKYDAAWVRGRLPLVFNYTPAPPEVEKTLLFETFVAVQGDTGIMFVCADHYGKSSLWFSESGPDEATKDAIAHAFWSLLLEAPDELAGFRSRVFHPGACVWIEYACESGELSCAEYDDE